MSFDNIVALSESTAGELFLLTAYLRMLEKINSRPLGIEIRRVFGVMAVRKTLQALVLSAAVNRERQIAAAMQERNTAADNDVDAPIPG